MQWSTWIVRASNSQKKSVISNISCLARARTRMHTLQNHCCCKADEGMCVQALFKNAVFGIFTEEDECVRSSEPCPGAFFSFHLKLIRKQKLKPPPGRISPDIWLTSASTCGMCSGQVNSCKVDCACRRTLTETTALHCKKSWSENGSSQDDVSLFVSFKRNNLSFCW